MSSVTFSDLPTPPLRITRAASESILRSTGEMRTLAWSGDPLNLPSVPIEDSDEDGALDRLEEEEDESSSTGPGDAAVAAAGSTSTPAGEDRGEGPSRPRPVIRRPGIGIGAGAGPGAMDRSRSDGPPSYEASSPDGPPSLLRAMGRVRLGGATPRDAPPAIADFFGTSPATRGEALPEVTLPNEVNGADDDDPLVPRLLRHPPTPNLRALQRRYTISEGVSSPVASPVLDETERTSPPPLAAMPPMSDFVASLLQPLDLPPPPSAELPAYNPHLARDELRLISAVHLDQNHPAAAYFTAVSSSMNRVDQPQDTPLHEDMSTGGKKMRVTLNRGGERMNRNGTGPMFIRMGRRGKISGRVHVGKIDHATDLEVAIIGLVNTSYYVRGQYTLIDTLPLGRERMILWPVVADRTPPGTPTSEAFDHPNASAARPQSSSSSLPSQATSTPGSLPVSSPSTSATPSSASTTATAAPPQATTSTIPPTPSKALMKNIKRRLSSQNTSRPEEEPVNWVPQNRTFEFELNMPYHHFRDDEVELPPSCQIIQVGMQAGIEYYLRVKLTRKGWRLNETISCPIVYEPRSYITPRRLRALTYNDVLNPGWRTIKLHGGKPSKSNPTPVDPTAPGVEVSLLLPSPPILFVGFDQVAPPIPFHLHFHSASTLPLKTFSDPRECIFVVRLMRVATMRIATEKEIRRVEIPSIVEVWQEGGPHLTIGQEVPTTTANTVTTAPVPAPAPVTEEPAAEGSEMRRVGSPPVHPIALTPTGLPVMSASGYAANSPARSSSTDTAKTKASSLADKRPAWMRRRSSASSPLTETASGRLAQSPPGVSSIPEASASSGPSTHANAQPHLHATHGPPAEAPSPFTPLPLDATDVHLLGSLQIDLKAGWEISKRLIQSFQTPEISVSYVLEVGLQPRQGAVREAFEHVWGGGLVEIVHGPRPAGAAAHQPPPAPGVPGIGTGPDMAPVLPSTLSPSSITPNGLAGLTPGGLMPETRGRGRPASAGNGSGATTPSASGLASAAA